MSFRKFDNDKPRFSLLPQEALDEVIAGLEHGAEEYGDYNWRRVDDRTRYYDALFRHARSSLKGDLTDEQTQLSHLALVITNALFLLQLEIEDREEKPDWIRVG